MSYPTPNRAQWIAVTTLIALCCGVSLSGCDPDEADEGRGNPCQPLLDEGISVSTEVTTSEPLLRLVALSGADRFGAGQTSVTLRSDGPLLAVAVPADACAQIGLGRGCVRPHAGDLLSATADQGALTVTSIDGSKSIALRVLGRWAPGEEVTLDNIGQWEALHLVQLDALAVAPDQSMPSHTLRATARVEVKACSAYPPYAAWLTRAASSLLVESPLMRCGDGILDSSESCDDGNDDAGDGCEVNRFNIDDLNAVCLPSPLTCHPDLAETWLAWRCEGVPSRCVQVTCTSPRDDLACGAGPWQPMPSTNASVEARVVVNGRTPGDAPHRAEVLMTSQARCGCEDTGWALRCDGACREAAICAQLTSAPAADLTLARWEGCRQPATSDTCAVDNLSYQQTVNAFFTREAAPSALRAPLPLAEGEQVRGLQAVAASAQGAAWAAFDTVSGVNAVPATQLFYLSPSAPLDAAPTALPSLVGAGGPAKILSISPSDDGQRAWVMASVKGHALWRGQLIEPPLSDVNAEGRVAVHITAAGDLLGVVSLRDEVSSQPLFDSNTPRISTSHASSPTWSAVIAYADILQGELILTAVTDSGDRVWRQVLRGQGGSWITLSGLFTDAQDNVWVSTSAGTFGDDTPYPELSGRGEPLLMQLSPDGASLRWVRSWRLSAGALTADGLGLWTLGYEFVPLSPAPSPLSLRRYDLEGALQVDTPFTAPPFSIDTDLADVRLWPQADGDLIVSRHDPLWALVLSRWTSPDPLQPASTWTRRWVERVETFSPLAPLFPLSPIAIAPSPRDPAQLEVMGRFSTTEGERLVLPLLP